MVTTEQAWQAETADQLQTLAVDNSYKGLLKQLVEKAQADNTELITIVSYQDSNGEWMQLDQVRITVDGDIQPAPVKHIARS